MTPTTRRLLPALALTALLLAGCGDDDAGGGVSASDVWARSTAPDASTAAFYLEIRNDADAADALTGAATDVCDMVEIHTMTMVDNVMSMMPADAEELTIEAGESLILEPGGLHVMCMGLREPLAVDDQVDLELSFGSGATLDVTADIREP